MSHMVRLHECGKLHSAKGVPLAHDLSCLASPRRDDAAEAPAAAPPAVVRKQNPVELPSGFRVASRDDSRSFGPLPDADEEEELDESDESDDDDSDEAEEAAPSVRREQRSYLRNPVEAAPGGKVTVTLEEIARASQDRERFQNPVCGCQHRDPSDRQKNPVHGDDDRPVDFKPILPPYSSAVTGDRRSNPHEAHASAPHVGPARRKNSTHGGCGCGGTPGHCTCKSKPGGCGCGGTAGHCTCKHPNPVDANYVSNGGKLSGDARCNRMRGIYVADPRHTDAPPDCSTLERLYGAKLDAQDQRLARAKPVMPPMSRAANPVAEEVIAEAKGAPAPPAPKGPAARKPAAGAAAPPASTKAPASAKASAAAKASSPAVNAPAPAAPKRAPRVLVSVAMKKVAMLLKPRKGTPIDVIARVSGDSVTLAQAQAALKEVSETKYGADLTRIAAALKTDLTRRINDTSN